MKHIINFLPFISLICNDRELTETDLQEFANQERIPISVARDIYQSYKCCPELFKDIIVLDIAEITGIEDIEAMLKYIPIKDIIKIYEAVNRMYD